MSKQGRAVQGHDRDREGSAARTRAIESGFNFRACCGVLDYQKVKSDLLRRVLRVLHVLTLINFVAKTRSVLPSLSGKGPLASLRCPAGTQKRV